jgi:hypothetical protein
MPSRRQRRFAVLFTRDAFGRALSQTVGNNTIALGFTASGDLDTLVTANDDTHIQDYNGVNLITAYLAPPVSGTDDRTAYATTTTAASPP